MNESKMPQLLWFFTYSMYLKSSVWEKSIWVWRDTGRDRKRVGICKHDICFYHLRDYKSEKKNLAWYWPPPILWASLRFEGCLNSLHQRPNQLFFEPKLMATQKSFLQPPPRSLLPNYVTLPTLLQLEKGLSQVWSKYCGTSDKKLKVVRKK